MNIVTTHIRVFKNLSDYQSLEFSSISGYVPETLNWDFTNFDWLNSKLKTHVKLFTKNEVQLLVSIAKKRVIRERTELSPIDFRNYSQFVKRFEDNMDKFTNETVFEIWST